MSALRRSDLDAALAFLADASDFDGPEPFTTELLDRLLELVPCEFATYFEVDVAAGVWCSYVHCSNQEPPAEVPGALSPESRDALLSSPGHVYCRRIGRLRGVTTWSEFADRGRRERYELDEAFQRQYGIVDLACVHLARSDVRQIWLILKTGGPDFSQRDRRLLEVLEPHLCARIGAARLRRRFESLAAALDVGDVGPAVVLATPEGEIEVASRAAWRLLDTYFGDVDVHLPRPLLNARNNGGRFVSARGAKRLIVEGVGRERALLLREEPVVDLTRRERDVVRCMAAGKTTAETARLLWVTDATVSKHLEHVYRKLGVTSRTAALAKLGLTHQ